MKMTVSFVIRRVVEFPVDVRRWPGLEATFFPLVLVITCLCEHRMSTVAQEENFTRIGQPVDWVVRTPPSLYRAFQTFCLRELLVIAEERFSHGGLLHTHRCEIKTISYVCKCHYRQN